MIISSKKQFGMLIRQTRIQKGLSGVQLASEAGMKQAVISGIENGLKGIRIDTMLRIAAALGVELDISFTDGESNDN